MKIKLVNYVLSFLTHLRIIYKLDASSVTVQSQVCQISNADFKRKQTFLRNELAKMKISCFNFWIYVFERY